MCETGEIKTAQAEPGEQSQGGRSAVVSTSHHHHSLRGAQGLAEISLQTLSWVTSKAASPSDSLCICGTLYFLNNSLQEVKPISLMSPRHI